MAFYPLMLNTAKRSRTTVEALEIKGYRYASTNQKVKKMKLSSLALGKNDGIFVAASAAWTIGCFLVSNDIGGMFL